MEIITDPAFLSILTRSEGGTASAVPSVEDGESAGPSMIVPFAARGFLERADALMAQEGAAAGTGGGGSINLEGRKEPNNEAPRTPDAPPPPQSLRLLYPFQTGASVGAKAASGSARVVRIMGINERPATAIRRYRCALCRAEVGNAALIPPAARGLRQPQPPAPAALNSFGPIHPYTSLYIPIYPRAGGP